MSGIAAVARAGRGLAWFVRGVVREDAYERYVEHVRAQHPDDGDVRLMTEREFWRDQTDRQETNPQGRCC